MTQSAAQLLVVADDVEVQGELVHELVGHGFAIDVVSDAREALVRIGERPPEAVVVSLRLGQGDPFELLEQGRDRARGKTAFVAIRRGQDVGVMVEAMQRGADHCLQWPEQRAALGFVLDRAIEKAQLARQAEQAREGVLDAVSVGRIEALVGAHSSIQALLAKVAQVAPSRATVLIQGETGTGKELIAAALHERSKRAGGPFVRLNCAALSETLLESELFGHERGAFTGAAERRRGRFEQAERGTLLLDEVSEISASIQVKVLRFLQEREFERVGGNETLRVDVRIVASTNRDLKALVSDGSFREDLYYRLNVVRLDVPPLRARPTDIPVLGDHFLRRFADENDKRITGFTPAAQRALLAHPWPGNVRELQNAIEQAVVMCRDERIDVSDLPIGAPSVHEPVRLMVPGVTLAELERYAILRTLDAVGGSPTEAASILGISRRTIQYRLQEWGMARKVTKRRSEPGDEG